LETERLHFVKLGPASYISHLDTYRAMMRAIMRSGVRVWFTEGFNSHMFISFPLPLPLGIESTCEVCDIKLLDEYDHYLDLKINPFLPKGIEIFNVTTPVMKTAEIASARYLIELDDRTVPREKISEDLLSMLSSGSIPIRKKSKAGREKLINASEKISAYSIIDTEEKVLLEMTCDAGSSSNLNPAAVISELEARLGRQLDHVRITRTGIMTRDMAEFA
jgi:radical SAM-linked protein